MNVRTVDTGDKIQLGLTAVVFVASVVLGGGQGGLGDTFAQLLALGLLGYLLALSPSARQALFSWHTPGWVVLLFLAVPLLHLALRPLGAERALWTLLPGVAIYLSTLALCFRSQLKLLGLFVLLAFAALTLGLLQLADGPDSALRFYSITNQTEAVGFFANRNHLASFLLMALPVSLAGATFAVSERINGRPVAILAIVATIGVCVLLILGIALTRSRAGLVLGMLGLLLWLPVVLTLRRRRGVKRAYAVIVSLALLLTVQFALYGILQRLQADPLGDLRWQIARTTAEAARQQLPVGSGLGSFRQTYQVVDTKAPFDEVINHAHNDFLELWLEAGWAFIVPGLVFLALLLWAGVTAWRASDDKHGLWPRAAWISLLLVVVHSAVDYPLRTTSNQAVFALLLAVLLSARWRASETQ